MRFTSLAAAAALAMASSAALAQPQTAPAGAAPADGRYSVATTQIGTLLDDPAAKAVLQKDMPGFADNPQIDMARGMTLKDVQQYAPDQMTDQTLAKVDADLAQLPVKK